jgi:hypothetical protein
MVPERSPIDRPNHLVDKDIIAEARRSVDKSLQVLRANPPPDTFLGRQKHQPAPLGRDEQ